jgi:acetyl-CoA carboxylase carboxyltransferase component
MGPCAGGAVYSPAITDFIIMVDQTAHMFITGPEVIKTVTNEDVSFEDLGGAMTHASKSGVTHFTVEDDEGALELTRELIALLPSNNLSKVPHRLTGDSPERLCEELDDIIPSDPNKPYDVVRVIESILDSGAFLEVQADFAANIVVGFGRLDGTTVGVVANQPKVLAGCLDIDASTKAARFVRFCDAFGIPLVTLVDVPGFMPGANQEWGGIIRHGAKLLYAYSEATVPKMTVILRKAHTMSCAPSISAPITTWPGRPLNWRSWELMARFRSSTSAASLRPAIPIKSANVWSMNTPTDSPIPIRPRQWDTSTM